MDPHLRSKILAPTLATALIALAGPAPAESVPTPRVAVAPEAHAGAEAVPGQAFFDVDRPQSPDAALARQHALAPEAHPGNEAVPGQAFFDVDRPQSPDAALARRHALAPEAHPGNETVPGQAFFDVDRPAPRVAPNPSSGPVTVSLAAPASFLAEVYDVSGRRVADLSGASGAATWDGRDLSGRGVPAGVYFVRVRAAAGPPETVRIVRR